MLQLVKMQTCIISREEASKKYHKYECGIVPIIWRSGASINNHIALRIIASKPLDYFLKLKPTIDEELTPEQLIRCVYLLNI